MPPVAKPNRRERRRAKFRIPKDDRIAMLDAQTTDFKRTLYGHELNIERLTDRLEALPPAPAEGEDPHEDERTKLIRGITAEETAMDALEGAIETNNTKITELKAS